MLSKEEIERKLEQTEDDGITINLLYQKIDLLETEIENTYWKGYIQKQNEATEICKQCKYIKKARKLESDKQKLIEKLEARIESVEKCYEELLTDIGGIKIINVTGLSKKEKEEVINKRNCLLVQKHCYQEILEILKGEKNEKC